MYKNTATRSQLKISLFSAFENVANTLITLTDVLVVASLGITHLTAMGAMLAIINFLQMSGQTISISNNLLVSRAIGEGNNEKVKLTSGNAVILTAIASFILIMITFIISPLLPGLFNVSRISLSYLYIRLIGFFQNNLVTVLSGHQKTIGNKKGILNIRIFAVLMNLFFNIVVLNFNFGIEGVAAVTVTIDTILATYLIITSRKTLFISYNKRYFSNLTHLLKWNSLERVITKVDNLLFNLIVSKVGALPYAIHIILIQIANVFEAFCQGFGDGITINVAIALGKAIKEYIVNTKRAAKKLIDIFSLIMPFFVLIFSFTLMFITFTTMHSSIDSVKAKMIFLGVIPTLIVNSYITTSGNYYNSMLRASKEFKFLALRNLFSSTLRISLAYLLSLTSLGVTGVWLSYMCYNISQKYLTRHQYRKLKLSE